MVWALLDQFAFKPMNASFLLLAYIGLRFWCKECKNIVYPSLSRAWNILMSKKYLY
jgi:hypothetical protein